MSFYGDETALKWQFGARKKFSWPHNLGGGKSFFFLQSLLEGGGRHLFIFAAKIRVRAAFIYADLDIHEGAGGPETLTINFTRPN